ncbi:hypothetical protein [Litorivivens sp.]|uniref:hypothetical protein n=1 Tax=Litorivivens sp. TaxID=2020868 RepID=UPI003567A9C6
MPLWLGMVLLVAFGASAHAANWDECRQVKRDSLRLQQALRKGVVLRGYRDRTQMRNELRDNNNWLWKRCRQYSAELRDLSAR